MLRVEGAKDIIKTGESSSKVSHIVPDVTEHSVRNQTSPTLKTKHVTLGVYC